MGFSKPHRGGRILKCSMYILIDRLQNGGKRAWVEAGRSPVVYP